MSIYKIVAEMNLEERCIRIVKEYGKFQPPEKLNIFTTYSENDKTMDVMINIRNKRDHINFMAKIENDGWNGLT